MKVIMIFFKTFKLLLFIYKLHGIEKVIYMNIYMQTISNCQTFIDNNLIIDDNNNKKVW